jgi:hypothetical protein
MHRPCKVLFDSADAGGQDAECLFLFYSSNANTNTKHSTLNLNRNSNSNKPQTQIQTSTFIPNSQTANFRVGTWMCLVIAMNAQESLRAKAHVPAARCPWQTAGTDDR